MNKYILIVYFHEPEGKIARGSYAKSDNVIALS
jgi:hypothetical protein